MFRRTTSVRAGIAAIVLIGALAAAAPPASAAPPDIDSFTIEVSDLNKVTLRWELSANNSQNLVYLMNDSGANAGAGADLGFWAADCDATSAIACQFSYRVTSSATQRVTLMVGNDSGELKYRTIENTANPIPKLAPPTLMDAPPPPQGPGASSDPLVSAQRVLQGPFASTPVKAWWNHDFPTNPQNSGWVGKAGLYPPIPVPLPAQPNDPINPSLPSSFLWGELDVTPASVDQPEGTSVQYCEKRPGVDPDIDLDRNNQPDPTIPLCSEATPFSSVRLAGVFVDATGRPVESRTFLATPQAIELRWRAGPTWGDAYYLYAPTLGITGKWRNVYETPPVNGIMTEPIAASAVTNGVHEITMMACNIYVAPAGCTIQRDLTTSASGTVTYAAGATEGAYIVKGDIIATVGSTPIPATHAGRVHRVAANGSSVTSGSVFAYLDIGNVERRDVVVGSSASFATTPSSNAFTRQVTDTSVRPSLGDALDVDVSTTGDAWVVGEFGRSLGQVDSSGLHVHDAPLARTLIGAEYVRTMPFEQDVFGAGGQSTLSVHGEKVLDTGDAVWFTQGGPLWGTKFYNHSRLVRFAKSAGSLDNPTPNDPRLCAIHVPGSQNTAVGLAYDGTRMWYSEWRVRSATGRIGWFVDDAQLGCDNDLVYPESESDTARVAAVNAASAANTCTTPSQTGCIHFVDLPVGVHPTHLEHQPGTGGSPGFMWFSDTSGNLGRITIATGAVDLFRLPPAIHAANVTSPFSTYPWQLRVTADAVYVVEFIENQIVRLDLAMVSADKASCQPSSGPNPCMREVSVPQRNPESSLHSVAVSGTTLWFTINNDLSSARLPEGGQVGCISLNTWTASSGPSGRVYSDLSSFDPSASRLDRSYRGIEINGNGDVLLADAGYDQLVRLTRNTTTNWSGSGWTSCPG